MKQVTFKRRFVTPIHLSTSARKNKTNVALQIVNFSADSPFDNPNSSYRSNTQHQKQYRYATEISSLEKKQRHGSVPLNERKSQPKTQSKTQASNQTPYEAKKLRGHKKNKHKRSSSLIRNSNLGTYSQINVQLTNNSYQKVKKENCKSKQKNACTKTRFYSVQKQNQNGHYSKRYTPYKLSGERSKEALSDKPLLIPHKKSQNREFQQEGNCLGDGLFSKIRKQLEIKRDRKYQSRINIIKQSNSVISKNNQYRNQNMRNLEIDSQQVKQVLFHFLKFQSVYSMLHKPQIIHKLQTSGLIALIRDYILQQNDVSGIESAYICNQSKSRIKRLIYYERVLILLIVECLIGEKYSIHLHHLKSIAQDILTFYVEIFKDLEIVIESLEKSQHSLSKNQLAVIRKYCQKNNIDERNLDYLKPLKQLRSICQSVEAKTKFILRHSPTMDIYLKSQSKEIEGQTSNLLYYNLLEYFSFFLLGENCIGWHIQFLQTCPSPYLHSNSAKPYTLVLDLDQTLIHYRMTKSYNGEFLLRPYLFEFLTNLAPYFEIGIFTCSLPQYADIILNHLKHLSFRLYRHHTVQQNGEFVKDLSRIGRDLKKVLIVDNIDRNFRFQKQNGIHIKSWYGDKKDNMLKKLQKQLIKLVQDKVQDVRETKFLRSFL